MKRLLLLGIMGCGLNFVASAVPIDCATLANNFAALQTAGVCFTLDVYFSGFTYNPLASGITAANVTANLTSIDGGGGFLTTGWSFGPNSASGGKWTSAMSIGYTVSICDAAAVLAGFCPASAVPLPGTTAFTQAQVQEFASLPRGANPSLTNDFTGNASTLHLPTSNVSNTTLTNSGFFGPPNSTVNPVLSSSTSGGNLISIEDDVVQTPIPEPATLFLLGSCLVVLGLNLKKFVRK